MNIMEIVNKLFDASKQENVTQEFKEIVIEYAQKSPVDLLSKIVDIAQENISVSGVIEALEAISKYNFHGKGKKASEILNSIKKV